METNTAETKNLSKDSMKIIVYHKSALPVVASNSMNILLGHHHQLFKQIWV